MSIANEISRQSPQHEDRGYAETDLFQPYLRCVVPRSVGKQLSPLVNHFVSGWELMNASVRNFRSKIMQRNAYDGLRYLLGETYEALSNNSAPPIGFDDMARTSRLVEALLAPKNRLCRPRSKSLREENRMPLKRIFKKSSSRTLLNR